MYQTEDLKYHITNKSKPRGLSLFSCFFYSPSCLLSQFKKYEKQNTRNKLEYECECELVSVSYKKLKALQVSCLFTLLMEECFTVAKIKCTWLYYLNITYQPYRASVFIRVSNI